MKPFKPSHLKIERADKHIAEFEKCVLTLPNAYAATLTYNLKIRDKTIQSAVRYHLPNAAAIQAKLALVIGDAIHNLRTALDFAWIAAFGHFNIPTNHFSKFPILRTAKELTTALEKRKVNIASPDLYKGIVSEIKPYPGGNDDIWAIHSLDILDKHQLLIPLMHMVAVTGIVLEDEKGNIVPHQFQWISEGGSLFVPLRENFHVKDKGKVTLHIVFAKHDLATDFMKVSDTLPLYSQLVLKIVEALEGFCGG